MSYSEGKNDSTPIFMVISCIGKPWWRKHVSVASSARAITWTIADLLSISPLGIHFGKA